MPTEEQREAAISDMLAALEEANKHLRMLYPQGIADGDYLCVTVDRAIASAPALQAEVERLREMLSIALNMLELIASKMPVGAEVRNKIEAECAAMRSASRSLLKRATTARGE